MSTRSLPCAIQCAELAAQRQSSAVLQRMKGRMTDLAAIAATAPFIGFFGTVLGISNSFPSIGSSKSAALAAVSNNLADALIPGAMGLLVALLAFWFYRYLSEQLEAFELETDAATAELVNRLLTYLDAIRIADPELWHTLARKPKRRTVLMETSADFEPPRLRLGRMYRNGVLELIWPQGDSDRELIRHAASWFCLAYAVIGYLAYWIQHRSLAGLVVFSFFVVAGFTMRTRAIQAAIHIFAFFAAAVVCLVFSPDRFAPAGVFFAVAPLPFLGMLRPAPQDRAVKRGTTTRLLQALLPLLFAGACAVVLFGTALGLYRTQSADSSMCPTIQPGDWLAGPTLSPADPIYRSEILEVNVLALGTARVVALPGDRIQIKAGQVILNGAPVREPYVTPYSGPDGDFPLSRSAYPDNLLPWGKEIGHGDASTRPYIVPAGQYFLLNDDRKQLSDSRSVGPLPRAYMVARLTLAYSTRQFPFSLPRSLQ